MLRKVLVPRANMMEAAKIGVWTVDIFLKKLSEIGFEIHIETENNNVIININMQEFNKNDIQHDKLLVMDVRPTIEGGDDPFKQIMENIKTLGEGQCLQIINIFEPIPLINHLKDMGFDSFTERPVANEVHTYFRKGLESTTTVPQEREQNDLNELENKKNEFGEKIKTIDVRHLEMPEPMVTILKEIELLPEGYALYVHHKRVPQYLLPELEKREFKIMNNEEDSENVKLLIYK